MDTSALEHKSLGNKHKQYNEMLTKALKGEEVIKLEDINFDKNDQDNLLMIDIASEKNDVKYILNVLKSEDMLYISRALHKCNWFFTHNQYAHIINPKYLDDQLLPKMTTKAGNKLLKYIRRYLRDEPRVEEFYLHEKRTKEAIKWLPNCSIPFIEKNVENCTYELDDKTFKRLCEKSVTIFEIVVKKNCSSSNFQSAMFLLTTHTNNYLDIVEQLGYYSYPKFNAKATDFLMKKCPDRIITNFEKYVNFIDIPTFANNMNKERIKDFLYEQANKDLSDHKYYNLRTFLSSPQITHLIIRIPKEERFDFVKKIFIDEIITERDVGVLPLDLKTYNMQRLSPVVGFEKYQWYKFAPFEIAFEEIKKLMNAETDHQKKYSMLLTVIYCVRKNEKDLQRLLQYYVNNHINDEYKLKYQFINNLIKHSQVHKYDKKSWEILNEIFTNMDVYCENDHIDGGCIIAIILYNTLNNENIPDVIYKKFSFDTLKLYRYKLNNAEKEKVFTFLYNYMVTKIQNQSITIETELNDMKENLVNMLNLLKDWKKELIDYPFVLNRIKDITKIKQKNSWNTSLATLYNLKKSWRKHMFEECLILYPSQNVCVNALKHDPGLLKRYNKEVQQLCCDDKISLRILHNKLRIYWPESLAINWTNAYRERLKVIGGHKALIRGLCGLVPEKSLINIIKGYAPHDAKINWKEIDELTLSLQRHIAKNMHYARPQIDPNAILWYAKGDYLQYTLPSLLAVFYNINSALSWEFIPKLLDAPVSVQKHGIRFAFLKLEPTKLKTIFLNIWETSKNPTIRAELFKQTFKLLCNSKENDKVEEIWTLLALFIENLTHTDETKIFELLVDIHEVPLNIRANYLIKCYNLFKRLQQHFTTDDVYRYVGHMQTLAEHSREVMESIDHNFVAQIIQDYLDKEFFNFEGKGQKRVSTYDGMVGVISAYLLCAKDVETQRQRYETILAPVIKRLCNMETGGNRIPNNQNNVSAILGKLYRDLNEYVIGKNVIIPYKMFCYIQEELKSLPIPETYVMVTMWKLTTALAKLLSENDTICKWDELTIKIAPEFADICLSYLKEDVSSRFTCIYVIFSRILEDLLCDIPFEARCGIYEAMLKDKNFVQAFLTIISILPTNPYLEDSEKQQYDNIHKIILEQPLAEIKMHYFTRFKRYIAQYIGS